MNEPSKAIQAVLFDRDNTLIVDVPYNRDPSLVEPMPTVVSTLQRLRELGIPVGVISNQSGVGRGLISPAELDRVNARVETLLGPFAVWRVCPHLPADSCECRKPQPGMVLSAAEELGVDPRRIGMIGDIGADIEAATRAGAHPVLVPTSITLPSEIETAPVLAATVAEAVEKLIPGVRA